MLLKQLDAIIFVNVSLYNALSIIMIAQN